MKNPILIKKNIKWGRREKEGVREEKEGRSYDIIYNNISADMPDGTVERGIYKNNK